MSVRCGDESEVSECEVWWERCVEGEVCSERSVMRMRCSDFRIQFWEFFASVNEIEHN